MRRIGADIWIEMQNPPLSKLQVALIEDVAAIGRVLRDAAEAQYQVSPSHVRLSAVEEGADAVEEAVYDVRRAALAAEVRETTAWMLMLHQHLRRRGVELSATLDAWHDGR